jgi:hypothetical protein
MEIRYNEKIDAVVDSDNKMIMTGSCLTTLNHHREEKLRESRIFSVDFNKRKKQELLEMLDEWIDNIDDIAKSRVGLRMLIRILQVKE